MPTSASGQFPVGAWIAKADADLGACRLLLANGSAYFEAAAFHAQQAAEKYVKAYFVARNIAFPKSHDLTALVGLVRSVDPRLASSLVDLDRLNPLAVESRYPSEAEALTESDVRQAMALATLARDSILAALEKS